MSENIALTLYEFKGDDPKTDREIAVEIVHDQIEDMMLKRLNGDFVIVEIDKKYVQFSADHCSGAVVCEAISNRFLPDDQQIFGDKLLALDLLGFRDEPDNYIRRWGEYEHFQNRVGASTAMQVLIEVLGCNLTQGMAIERGVKT